MLKKVLIVGLTAVALVANVSIARAEEATPTTWMGIPISTTSIEADEVPAFLPQAQAVNEPNIRVAVWKTNETIKFQSPFEYRVFVGEELQGSLPANEKATLLFKKDTYYFKSESVNFESKDFVKMIPVDQGSYFTVLNLVRKTSTKSPINYNTYRGEMIYQYSPRMKTSFVINRLPLESYVAGIGEAPNEAPTEYLRALLVAARSYGFFYINYGDNSKKMFDVYASTIDQLYLGYNCEIKRPNVADAGGSTYGEMVTYEDKPVIAPYFGNSNGTTLTWKEVWGGQNKPWLKPVECVFDKGKKKWGHGVGMSTQDAMHLATDKKLGYYDILTHYYTDTVIERIY